MDWLTDIASGAILDWLLASPIGGSFLAIAVTVVTVAVVLENALLLARKLAAMTPFAWDDTAADRGLVIVRRVLEIARLAVQFDTKAFKRIGAVLDRPAQVQALPQVQAAPAKGKAGGKKK